MKKLLKKYIPIISIFVIIGLATIVYVAYFSCVPATVGNGRYDLNNDNILDQLDLDLFIIYYNSANEYEQTYDFDCSGFVDDYDLALIEGAIMEVI